MPQGKLQFPGGSDGKESACNAGDLGLIPGSGRSSKQVNGNPLQCSSLENPRDRRAWWAAIYGVAQSRTPVKQLSSSSSLYLGFPGGLVGKESACNAGDLGLSPRLGRSPGEGNSYPLQYSGLENSMNYSMGSQRVKHD